MYGTDDWAEFEYSWTPDIDSYMQGQKTLERQRYQFPNDWLFFDQVELEWTVFNEILGRKNTAIQEQFGESLRIIF